MGDPISALFYAVFTGAAAGLLIGGAKRAVLLLRERG